jgi:hypothetical protein
VYSMFVLLIVARSEPHEMSLLIQVSYGLIRYGGILRDPTASLLRRWVLPASNCGRRDARRVRYFAS